MTSAFAPGYEHETEIIGLSTDGNSLTPKLKKPTPPKSKMISVKTVASTGLFMLSSDIFMLLQFYLLAGTQLHGSACYNSISDFQSGYYLNLGISTQAFVNICRNSF